MMRKRKSERGQSLVLLAFLLIAFMLFLAWVGNQGSLYWLRRESQKVSDSACLDGAIASMNGSLAYNAIIANLNKNAFDDPTYYQPQEGSGTGLGKGIEVGGTIRVALWGPAKAWIPSPTDIVFPNEIGARAHCKEGIGGPAPLANKEWEEPDSRILETETPNDVWSGPCPDQSIDPSSDPSTRDPANCWVWGDWQVLAGDGHLTNERRTSMNGLIAPDVRCVDGPPGDTNMCDNKLYLQSDGPPTSDVPAVNTLKSETMAYIAAGGYDGPEPIPGVFTGPHSANVAQMEGVPSNFLVQEIDKRYDVGDLIVAYVYANGKLWDGNKNFDYIEVIGLAVFEIVYMDANTVAVVPVYPEKNEGDMTTMRDDLPRTIAELEDAGFDLKPALLPWG